MASRRWGLVVDVVLRISVVASFEQVGGAPSRFTVGLVAMRRASPMLGVLSRWIVGAFVVAVHGGE